jgi:F0F1-type ATP synthase delta subunit
MKNNKEKLYAKALAEVLVKKGVDERKIVANFVKILVSAGLQKKSKEILNLAEYLVLAKQGKRKICFETARKMTVGQKKLMDNFIKNEDKVSEKINSELIAGIKIIINDSKQFDATLYSKLQNIF